MGYRFLLLVIFIVVSSCSASNIFEFTADKKSDESLIFKMQKYINDSDPDSAITVYDDEMTAAQQISRPARELYGHAYSAKCGLDFIGFVNDISGSSSRFFITLLESIASATAAQVTACDTAESIIDENIANLTPIAKDYNMALLNGMVKMGAILNLKAALPADTLDPAFDPCNVAHISDLEVTDFITGLTRVLSYADDSSLTFFSALGLDAACTVGQPLQLAGLCDTLDTADVTAGHICAARALMNEDAAVGLGSCSGDVLVCACGGCPF